MDKFDIKNGQFWLNEEPQFIQAGEFHYFRTPPDQWRHRLGLLKAAGFNALATYIPWLWHQLDEDVSDFDGHSHPMRNLEGFFDLAGEMGFLIIARPGPYIMAETINEGIPPWVFQKYPGAAFISQDHKVQNVASYMHPDFLACVKKWYKAIFGVLMPRQITRGGKIILIQLDNEMGMIQWVRNIMDTNPDTISKFAEYIEKSNDKSLNDHYPKDNLAKLLRDGILNPENMYAAKIVEDYRVFYREYLREYVLFLWSEAISNGMDVPPVINIHGFMRGGKTFPIGLSQLIKVMRLDGMISATDVYPGLIGEGNFHELLMVNEMTKALQTKQQALFSIEFQCGGNHDFSNTQSSMYDLHSRLCISSGMRAINHYLFFGGENDPILSPVKRHDWGPPVRKDGTLRHHYYRYAKLSKVLASYGTDLILSEPKTTTTIGFMLDTFMTEVNNEFTRESTKIITHQREAILFDMIARGLSLSHRSFNAIDLDSQELDVAQMPVCWVMMEKQCHAKTQQKLVDYIQKGGKMILAGRMCVEDFNHQACTILQDAIGIRQINGGLPFEAKTISVFDHDDVPVSFLETYTGGFDEVFARYEKDEIVGFIKNSDKGEVMVFGAAMPVDTLEELDIVEQMANMMDCPALFTMSNWADIRLSCGENGSFLFINNYQDDPIETTIALKNEPLFGGNAVCIAARQGLILPLDWQFTEGVMIHYVTSEIVEITDDGSMIKIRTAQDEFNAEFTLSGYNCDQSITMEESVEKQRIKIQGDEGEIILRRIS
jgi:beta-galactosidase